MEVIYWDILFGKTISVVEEGKKREGNQTIRNYQEKLLWKGNHSSITQGNTVNSAGYKSKLSWLENSLGNLSALPVLVLGYI